MKVTDETGLILFPLDLPRPKVRLSATSSRARVGGTKQDIHLSFEIVGSTRLHSRSSSSLTGAEGA